MFQHTPTHSTDIPWMSSPPALGIGDSCSADAVATHLGDPDPCPVGAVYHHDHSICVLVVCAPEGPQTLLPAQVPHLKHIRSTAKVIGCRHASSTKRHSSSSKMHGPLVCEIWFVRRVSCDSCAPMLQIFYGMANNRSRSQL